MTLRALWPVTQQFQNKNGSNLVGGKIYIYFQGRTALATTYHDSEGTVVNANPVLLDNNGRATVFADTIYSYTIVVCDYYGKELFSQDITLHDAISTAEDVLVMGSNGSVQVDTTTLPNGVQYDLSINTDIIATKESVDNVKTGLNNLTDTVNNHTTQIEQIQEDINGIDSSLADKKDKQNELNFNGSATKTVKKITQNANGELNVEFEDINLPQEVPNVEITSEDKSIKVSETTDVQTNTKKFDLSVQDGGTTYSAGDAIDLTNDTISVKYGKGLEITTDNRLQLKVDKGLTLDNDTLDLSIKDLATSITDFRDGDVIAVDGPSGIAKMSKDDLLKEAAQNSLSGNVAPAFDPTKANDSDGFAYYINDEVIYNGKLYRFKANHSSGAWVASQVNEISTADSAKFNLDGANLASRLKLAYGFLVNNDGKYAESSEWHMGVISATDLRNKVLEVKSATSTNRELRFAFVKSFSPSDGGEVDYCEGSSIVVMNPGTVIEKIVPPDCSFVLVWFYGTDYPFDEIKFFIVREMKVEQPATIRPEVYYNKSIHGSTYEFITNSNGMVHVYPISGYKELYLNYDNTFNYSNLFTPVYFADANLARISGILIVPSDGIERMYARNMKITDFPANAAYIVMVTYNRNDAAAINCITASPIGYDSRRLRKLEPTRHNGTFFYQSGWIYASNWRLNAFEYDVTGCLWLAVDHCIDIYSGGPFEYVFKLSDDSYMQVWNRTAYTKYGSKIIIPVPSNAVKLIVNSSPVKDKNYYLPRVYSLENTEMDDYFTLDHFIQDEHKVLSFLFIGNSLTQDAVSYLPLLLREVCPDIEFNIYMWYCGGYTLKQQWENKINPSVNAACEIFSLCNTDISWVNGSIKMSDAAKYLRFDFVCLQEYFNYVESYSAADTIYFNNIVNYIAGLVGFKFEVDCLFHAPKRGDNFESIYTMTKNGNIIILKNTPAVDIFVPGCAIYEACKTSLDALGDLGHLSPDGTHAQEGLPCLLEAYVMLLQILNKLGRPMTIEGVTSVVDTSNYASINVPGPNLGTGVVVGTADDYEVAKQVAASSTNKKFAIMSETF